MKSSDFIQAIEKIEWLSKADHISSVLNTTYNWEWLPSSRDQNNPFPIDILDKSKELEKSLASISYKAALISLRKVGPENSLLLDSPHNYTETFKGAALYCVRLAAKEYASGQKGKWSEILEIYRKGRWPCGIQEDGEWVIL
ncbi:hypothetical protein [Halomonas sp. HG01]|uniref:hypothetical protein n=1 Tax=Halomonas sp. HG01 TaxID=1609967 RepID=UPI00128BB72A|nr:hypothetical protein [Halomonas sp. HG01]